MTCIAVVRGNDGAVWMGADSSSIRQGTKMMLAAGKMADLGGGVYVGVAGKQFTFQVIKHGFTFPHPQADEDVQAWMVTKFAPALRKRVGEAGAWNPIESEGEPQGSESLLLVVAQGHIFEISNLCEPTEVGDPYHAIGNGEDVATGALFALMERTELRPQTVLGVALRAAMTHRENIAPPFTFMCCSPTTEDNRPCDTPACSLHAVPKAPRPLREQQGTRQVS